jgi:hypothetical protein
MRRILVVARLASRSAGLQPLRSLGRLRVTAMGALAFLLLRARILGNATRSCGL